MEAVGRTSPVAERSLAVLATGAVLAFGWLARELLLPTALAVFVAFTVQPLVRWLERRRLPRWAAAALGTLVATAVVAVLAIVLYDAISGIWEELPAYEDKLRAALGKVSRTAKQVEAQTDAVVKQPGTVKLHAGVPWGMLLLGTAQGALAIAAEATVAVFALYFALAEGPRYRQKLLASLDPDGRRHADAALGEVHRDVEQYMVNRVLLNAALGLVTWGAYALYGLEHASLWGLTTALLHFVPYVGPAAGLALPALMALLQYGALKDVLLVSGIYVALVALQGNVIDPVFLGKQLRLSSLAVFLGSLFWFWIWGPIGLFLAVPLLSTIRIACAHTPRLHFVARFLAE
ncbi:MAG TPA: AI-2E family transporter [Anaeromyxobacteraceae bacterium]|nr:AI-2E family transporter [Anaeromyxobacteraceae bacterium]